ncbi:MAG: exonuclease SbcCD subunit D [Anaerolineales bacterium]|nr:exonuclease SbcCD subunit D [Anaerolineales bacterium]
MKLLHFADAHIDMANYGRHDPESGLPLRVMDFLKSLDTIVDTAIDEQVDLVLFAGDTYKDKNPAPTFQREWDRRMIRLSRSGIPTVLLVGNHDISPSFGRAHALNELKTLEIPNITVVDSPTFLKPENLNGLPLQIIAIPWITRSGMVAHLDLSLKESDKIFQELEERLSELIQNWLNEADPEIPVIIAAHATIQGAKYGGERTVMLGGDLVLTPGLVKDSRISYVALGHIHKAQDLNEGNQPPIVYPGSIERVDFGEAGDKKFFVLVDVEKGQNTQVHWQELKDIRPFIDRSVTLTSNENVNQTILDVLPPRNEVNDSIFRLVLNYPKDLEKLIDDQALRSYTESAFEFHLVKRPQMEIRTRLPEGTAANSLSPEELLEFYWNSTKIPEETQQALLPLAKKVIADTQNNKVKS